MRLPLATLSLALSVACAHAADIKVIDPDAKFPEGPFVENGVLYYAQYGASEVDKWDGSKRTKLQAEQKAWLVHHLGETRRLASDPDTGSGAFMISQSFELDDIAKRTLELEKRVRNPG